MRPLKLIMSAFGPYAEKIVLDFRALGKHKFFLINGATGSGKTTILDAVCYALYGDASGDLRTGKTVRSGYAKPEQATEVELTFAVGEKIYRVHRAPEQERPKKRGIGMTLRTAEAELWHIEDDAEKSLCSGYSDVTKRLEGLLGFRSSQFRQVVLLPQGEFRKLLTANSRDRQEIMQTLFQTGIYQQLEEQLKQTAKQLKDNSQEKLQKKEWLLDKAEVNMTAEYKALVDKINNELNKQQEAGKAAAAKQQKLQAEFNAGEKLQAQFVELKAAEAKVQELKDKAPIVKNFRPILEKARKAAGLKDIQENREQTKNEYNKMQHLMEIVNGRLKESQANVVTAAKQLEQAPAIEAALRELQGQQLKLGSWQSKLQEAAKIQQELKAVNAQAAELKKQKTALQTVIKQQEQTLSQAQAELPKLAAQAALLESGKVRCTQLADDNEKLQRLNVLNSQQETLVQALAAVKKECSKLQKALTEKQALADKLRHLFLHGQAAIMAAELKEDEACPVCGSLQHPHLAISEAELPSQQEIDRLQNEADSLQIRLDKANAEHLKLNEQQSVIAGQISQLRQDTAQYEAKDLAKELKAAEAAVKQSEKAGERWHSMEKSVNELQNKLQVNKAAVDKNDSELNTVELKQHTMQSDIAVRIADIPKEYQTMQQITAALECAVVKQQADQQHLNSIKQAHHEALQKEAGMRAEYQSRNEQLGQLKLKYDEIETGWKLRLKENGFADEKDYIKAREWETRIDELDKKITDYEQSCVSSKDREERARSAVKGKEKPDMEALQAALDTAIQENRRQLEAAARIGEQKKQLVAGFKELVKIDAELAEFDKTYGVIGRLTDVTSGKENGINFERFVLSALLEEVTVAANQRLKTMSRGRYLLERTDERTRSNSPGGLELAVFDNYTGAVRGVGTLSGGESFLASLSLSLGLADVVQNYAGGIHLDTIIVDEGFGTLDPEMLEMAMRTLLELQKGGRLVGIISHVPELKERIEARLDVIATKEGSTAKFVIR